MNAEKPRNLPALLAGIARRVGGGGGARRGAAAEAAAAIPDDDAGFLERLTACPRPGEAPRGEPVRRASKLFR